MAHNIATLNGQAAFVYLDQTAWHGLGTSILSLMQRTPAAERIDAAMQAAGLGFTVETRPLYLADGTPVQGHKATVRLQADGTIGATLGVVGDGYKTIQNAEAVEVLRPLAEEFGCVPAAAGVLGDGERCWMLMRLADTVITPIDGDDVRGYFLLYWDHAGQASLKMLGTPIRVVCQNTLNMATGHGSRAAWINVRHTTNADKRLDEAAGIIRKLMQAMQATGDTFASMAHKRLNARQIAEYIAAAIPNTDPKSANLSPVIEARRETIAQLVHNGRGAALANAGVSTIDGGASVWAAYNAVTEYFDHVRPAEATNESGLRRAFESSVFGGNADTKAQALQLASQLVAA